MLRKNQFVKAAQFAGSQGVVEATEDAISGITPLFPDPSEVSQADLLAYYGPPAAPLQDNSPSSLSLAVLKECLDAAPLPHVYPS